MINGEKGKAGIYVHIPFCRRKCPYCDFYSLSLSDKCCTTNTESYTNAIVRHVESYKAMNIVADTVYFGGGTPTSLEENQLERILDAVKNSFILDADSEITVEANPCTVDLRYLVKLRRAGFNRISFGVQSADDMELEGLGRLHSFSQAQTAVENGRKAGFENISCDLMIGVLGQSTDSLLVSVDRLCEMEINHISAYMLKIEASTPYDCERVRAEVANDDLQADMYLAAVKSLAEHGFAQYEISNFCRGGKVSRHNMKYWTLEDYLGFGPSAHSFFGGKRFFYKRDISGYINSPQSVYVTEDDNPDKLEEYTMLSLRLSDGLSRETYAQLGGNVERLEMLSKSLIKAGFALYDGDYLKLTPKGFLVSNSIIAELL